MFKKLETFRIKESVSFYHAGEFVCVRCRTLLCLKKDGSFGAACTIKYFKTSREAIRAFKLIVPKVIKIDKNLYQVR